MTTQPQIAKHLDLSVRTVAALMAAGVINKKGSLDDCRVKYIRYLRDIAAGRISGGDYDLLEERARLAHHQANNEALKEAINRRELIPAPDIIEAWSEMVGAMRARLLALPGRLANRVMSFDTVRDAEDYAREEVYSALQELGDAGTGKAKDEA